MEAKKILINALQEARQVGDISSLDVDNLLAKLTTESFKAGYDKALAQLAGMTEECKQMGRKEVVEWIKYFLNIPEIKDTYADKIIRPQLKSKLKEWGL